MCCRVAHHSMQSQTESLQTAATEAASTPSAAAVGLPALQQAQLQAALTALVEASSSQVRLLAMCC